MYSFLSLKYEKLPFRFQCVHLVIDCGDPGTPWHGYLHGANFHYGSTVTFSCRPQHHLEGDSQRTCQGDGQWSGQQPKCLGKLKYKIILSPSLGLLLAFLRSVANSYRTRKDQVRPHQAELFCTAGVPLFPFSHGLGQGK